MQNEKEIELVVLNQAILPQIEDWLSTANTGFLVNDDITAADLVLYHELLQLNKVSSQSVSESSYPATVNWMGSIFQELGEKLENVVIKMD